MLQPKQGYDPSDIVALVLQGKEARIAIPYQARVIDEQPLSESIVI